MVQKLTLGLHLIQKMPWFMHAEQYIIIIPDLVYILYQMYIYK